jgi:pyruvate dehydrogenase E2 component (dihydrolipoamide acetyltransferase)
MISEVVMPQMGADMTEGTLLKWLKSEGDAVARGDVIAEIETDKANIEIEAFESGVFRRALATEGDVVLVGAVIAVIAGAEDDISAYAAGAAAPAAPLPKIEAAPTLATARPPETATLAPALPPQPPAVASGRLRSSPLARKLAAERGIDLTRITGSGPDGRIMQKDLERAPAASSAFPRSGAPPAAPAGDTVVVPTKMRQAIARRMSHSKREAPHYYLLVDIDMTDAMAMRAQLNELVEDASHVSINDLIVRACALALQQHPQFNATIEGDTITRHAEQHICIAVALDDGLIAPAIVGAGAMTLTGIAVAARDVSGRARNGALRPDEVTKGTFTITNLGAYGIETLIGIIQPPQTAILGAGTVMPQPVVRDGAVVVRQIMKVALSADHRVTDGAEGAVFLGEIKHLLEKPLALEL